MNDHPNDLYRRLVAVDENNQVRDRIINIGFDFLSSARVLATQEYCCHTRFETIENDKLYVPLRVLPRAQDLNY